MHTAIAFYIILENTINVLYEYPVEVLAMTTIGMIIIYGMGRL